MSQKLNCRKCGTVFIYDGENDSCNISPLYHVCENFCKKCVDVASNTGCACDFVTCENNHESKPNICAKTHYCGECKDGVNTFHSNFCVYNDEHIECLECLEDNCTLYYTDNIIVLR